MKTVLWVFVAMLAVCTQADAATIKATATGGMWHYGSTWVGGVVPTAADDVVLDSTCGNVIMRYSQQCQSIDCTGYTGTLTLNSGRQLLVGTVNTPPGNYATFSPTMTLNAMLGCTVFCGKSGAPLRGFASGGQVFQTVKLMNSELLDDVICNANGLYVYEAFFSNNHMIVSSYVRVSGATTVADFGTSLIQTMWFDARTYAVCDVASADLRMDAYGVIQSNDVQFGEVTFSRGGYYEIRGSNEFSRMLLSGPSAATTFEFANIGETGFGSTITLTGANPLPSGDAAGQVTFMGYGAWNVSAAIGTVHVDYATIQNSQAGGGATFEAGVGSIDNGGNSGWAF